MKGDYGNVLMPENFDFKDQHGKTIISKHEDDLFDEKKHIVEKVIRVRRVSRKGEKWHITENDKIICTIEASKISKKEKEYLRTASGVVFLIDQFKKGIRSVSKLRTEMKRVID